MGGRGGGREGGGGKTGGREGALLGVCGRYVLISRE